LLMACCRAVVLVWQTFCHYSDVSLILGASQ
jgi:hypothetical protein